MIEITDAAREEIAKTVKEQGDNRTIRIYIAGHG